MEKILLVEDADFFGNIIERRLQRRSDTEVTWVKTMEEARLALSDGSEFSLALLDLNLPDANGTEIVELVAVEKNVPSIVFSASYERVIRDSIVRLGVIDYIIKESPASLEYLFQTVNRIIGNRNRIVLIADDSTPERMRLKRALEEFQLTVIAVRDGAEALAVLRKREDISLVITDFVMPNMDGLEFTKAVVREFHKRRLAIIGVSAFTESDTHIQFLKAGANDFLGKPFEREQLFCRVSQNLNALDRIDALHSLANKDQLTGFSNRRSFFEIGESKLAQAQRSGESCAIMMMSVDNFRAVNDYYGYEAGDEVVKGIAERLEGRTRKSDLIARFSGKEFTKLLIAPDPTFLPEIARAHLAAIAETPIRGDDENIAVTLSIGIAYGDGLALGQLIDNADQHLSEAKAAGGNQAVMSPAASGKRPLVIECPVELVKYYV
ncbi:MAG: response regulator [Pseudomonadota bacterium]